MSLNVNMVFQQTKYILVFQFFFIFFLSTSDLICFINMYFPPKRSDCYEHRIYLIITSKPIKPHSISQMTKLCVYRFSKSSMNTLFAACTCTLQLILCLSLKMFYLEQLQKFLKWFVVFITKMQCLCRFCIMNFILMFYICCIIQKSLTLVKTLY